jgi:hypothetical protein
MIHPLLEQKLFPFSADVPNISQRVPASQKKITQSTEFCEEFGVLSWSLIGIDHFLAEDRMRKVLCLLALVAFAIVAFSATPAQAGVKHKHHHCHHHHKTA